MYMSYDKLQELIGYKFKKHELLIEALSHSSYSNEQKTQNNERLEFLGDSIIGFLVTKHLFSLFPDYNEGELSKLKNQIVSSKSFYEVSKDCGLDDFILLGKGESKTGGKRRESNLAGLFEAICGAIFLDSGIRSTEKFLRKFLLNQDFKEFLDKDYKSILQVLSQKHFGVVPHYITSKETGPPHNKKFYISVFIEGKKFSSSIGKSKKEGQNICAKNAIQKLCITIK